MQGSRWVYTPPRWAWACGDWTCRRKDRALRLAAAAGLGLSAQSVALPRAVELPARARLLRLSATAVLQLLHLAPAALQAQLPVEGPHPHRLVVAQLLCQLSVLCQLQRPQWRACPCLQVRLHPPVSLLLPLAAVDRSWPLVSWPHCRLH